MPFPDELGPVEVVAHRPSWPGEFDALRAILAAALGDEAVEIDHIGSTAVPGLAAKDVIDVQVRVRVLDRARRLEQFARIGFRWRPEEWNNLERSRGGPEQKLVFAPPAGERRANVNVRVDESRGSADALLFRDYLRDDAGARDRWGAFKVRLAAAGPVDLIEYGQGKQGPWQDLMADADAWARDRRWEPPRPTRAPVRPRLDPPPRRGR